MCTITMFGNSDGQYRLVDHNSCRVREAVTTRGQDHRRDALVDDESFEVFVAVIANGTMEQVRVVHSNAKARYTHQDEDKPMSKVGF